MARFFQRSNRLLVSLPVDIDRQFFRPEDDKSPVVAAPPGAQKSLERRDPALLDAGTKQDRITFGIETDDDGEMPPGYGRHPEVLQNDDGTTGSQFIP